LSTLTGARSAGCNLVVRNGYDESRNQAEDFSVADRRVYDTILAWIMNSWHAPPPGAAKFGVDFRTRPLTLREFEDRMGNNAATIDDALKSMGQDCMRYYERQKQKCEPRI